MPEKITLAELAERLQGPAGLTSDLEEMLAKDSRRGAGQLLERYRRREASFGNENKRLHSMLNIERKYWQLGFKKIAGVDEAGRGPLAGPVIAAAVIMPPEIIIPGLNDSKQLTALQRERLFEQICDLALGVGVGTGTVEDIAHLNIYGALMAAMREALAALPVLPEIVLVDGYPVRGLQIAQEAVKKGDTLSLSIAAASVIAKVTRDRFMKELHRRFPCYGFDRNKGYATPGHRRALARYGSCCFHRQGFRLFGESAQEKES